jgi:mannosyltransferase OCH1-like enzyme
MTFTQMIQKSYAYNETLHRSSSDWIRAKELFICNIPDNKQRIPKKIHQVWLGSPVPDIYRKYMDTWPLFHPEWEYKVWTDADVDSIEIKSRRIFDKAVNPAMKSDILRYEILRQHGGLYVDTDFQCLKPFDDLLYLNFFTGISYDDTFVIYNGLIASIPDHPILNDSVIIGSDYSGNIARMIIETTGAYHFTRCFNKNITPKTVAFPMDYFYPYPNNDKGGRLDPMTFVTEDSYAIHHWKVSWIKR